MLTSLWVLPGQVKPKEVNLEAYDQVLELLLKYGANIDTFQVWPYSHTGGLASLPMA